MTRLTLVSLVVALVLLVIVLELVRRRRLQERYSLLWLLAGVVVLVFAAWPAALGGLAGALGIAYPSNALFIVAGGFFFLVLLHYSTAISRLSEQNTRLAQRLALLEERLLRSQAAERSAVAASAEDGEVAVAGRRERPTLSVDA